MWSDFVVPVKEVFFGGEGVSVAFVHVEPSFYFAVALGVFDATEDLFDVLVLEEFLELGVAIIVVGELASVVADALFDAAVTECFVHSLNAGFCCWAVAFQEGEECSACVVFDGESPWPIHWSLMPVNVHGGQAVPPLVPYPILLSHVPLHFLLRKA